MLLCSDLDRTLIPNGNAPESPEARGLLRVLATHPELTLVYVSGRSGPLIREAITAFALPTPDYAIGDVGTTLYEVKGDHWHAWPAWADEIAQDWGGRSRAEVAALVGPTTPTPQELTPQEDDKQGDYKLSYYADTRLDPHTLGEVKGRLETAGVRASLIWSVDEDAGRGLVDVLPRRADKLQAIRFLMRERGFHHPETVFAGDSGNDLAVLTSELQAVLVANAAAEVRAEAVQQSDPASLYLAQGGFMGMNGNYAAGVLEGLAHFLPGVGEWLRAAAKGVG